MISELLIDIEDLVPCYPETDEGKTNWQSLTDEFAPRMIELGAGIRAAVEAVLGATAFEHSVDSCISRKKPSHILSEYQIRPEDNYYNLLSKPIPAPKNPTGPHATGISISIWVTRCVSVKGRIQHPSVYLDFNVWGSEERQAFADLLRDYRRPIKLIIEKYGFEFATAVPFDNVDKLQTKKAFQLLSAYFENESDPESNFTLTAQFGSESNFGEIIKAAVPLAILYYATEGYAQKRKERDRLVNVIGLGGLGRHFRDRA